MRPNPSFTAETVALQRSFESQRPPVTLVLFTDPYVDAFLRLALRTLARASAVPGLRRLAVGLYDAIGGPVDLPPSCHRSHQDHR